MVESNLQRSVILPSEKAFAYKMRLEAMKRQGERSDLTSPLLVEKSAGKEALSVSKIGKDTGDSHEQVRRFIRLTELVPEILQMVDERHDIVNITLHFFLKDVRPMLLPVMKHNTVVA